MNTVRDYSRLAADILSEVGGQENLVNFSRCATRLRLVLKTLPPDAEARVKALTGVITVVIGGGQFQVVIGTHVADVYDAFAGLVDSSTLHDGPEKKRWLDAVIATMSAVFAPIIYILAAAGILQGLLILLRLFWPTLSASSTVAVLNFISWTPFAFLPVFIAVTAAKHFKCNPFIALFCCCALINPEWAVLAGQIANGARLTFLHLPLAETVYTSSVLPPLFLVWLLAWLERGVSRRLPEVVSPLFTPLICAVVMVPLTLLLIGPLTSGLATTVAAGYNSLFAAAPPLAAAVIGGFWQILVIFGVHWGITPVIIANFDLYGRDSFQAFQTMAVMGQMAAAFACAWRTRQKRFRTVALSAGITGIFGITEPAIYGVTLRLKKPFICGCIGAAAGAVVASLFGSYYYAYAGLPGLLTVVNAISPENPASFMGEISGAAVTVVLTFALVWLVAFKEPQLNDEPAAALPSAPSTTPPPSATPAAGPALSLNSPLSGRLMPLTQVQDPAFASGALGEGVAILPDDGEVVAPCDAEVASVIDTGHAVGLLCDNGAELLIHVGLDTVKLQGQFFTPQVSIGERVRAGQPLIRFDREQVLAAGYDITTPFLIVNSDDFTVRPLQAEGPVHVGMPVLSLAPLC
ncbi:glucose PTS transporter subunit IIA [Pantoea sp. 1.19]|uniref:glucose PTS transporter subunit IIA n=1 Tax=Pantoea sp. 1.19 TaxID=1925589 RepID=UPI0009489709|nr:glucose PTS transporter subunit IIA [Pantoea sp. 1.19]